MRCYLCGNEVSELIQEGVRYNPSIKVYRCTMCGLIFIDNYKINYAENEMNEIDSSDTMDFADTKRRFENYRWWFHNSYILDFGCGKGSLLTKLKAVNCSCQLAAFEPNKQFAKYLAENFSLYTTLESIPNDYFYFITLFHVLEHLDDPVNILNTLFDKLLVNGRIIIEVPNHADVFNLIYKSEAYRKFIYTPYHKFYFNADTLRHLLSKTLFEIEYIKTEQRYELSNHLYWLAKYEPNGHIIWPYLNSLDYKQKLELLGM